MIPKIIHYCWFGGKKKNKEILKYIDTWKKLNPDYKIIEWNEQNFDIRINKFVEEAYKSKKFAFVSDYARLYALYNYGGIYLDVDVEAVKRFQFEEEDKLITSFELNNIVMTGVIASSKNQFIIKEMMEIYNTMNFIAEDGSLKMIPNTVLFTDLLIKHGLELGNKIQNLGDGIKIYPRDYYCGIDNENSCLEITNNTITIHHYLGSWMPIKDRMIYKLKNIISKTLGNEQYNKIKKVYKKIKE